MRRQVRNRLGRAIQLLALSGRLVRDADGNTGLILPFWGGMKMLLTSS